MFKMIETKFSKRKFIESKNKKHLFPSLPIIWRLYGNQKNKGCVLEGLTNKKEGDKIGKEGDK